MKIELTKELLIGLAVHPSGAVVDVEEARAKELIRLGHAREHAPNGYKLVCVPDGPEESETQIPQKETFVAPKPDKETQAVPKPVEKKAKAEVKK